jgi:hypothetical protein
MTSATERMIVLRVRGLDCWAVSGLGCGSLIAPALAKIGDLAPDARSDHSGAYLRFADRGRTEAVRQRLGELGYDSQPLGESESLPMDWFTPDDLSREEAQVLAARMVPAFIHDHPDASEVSEALRQRVEATLFGCFTDKFAGSGSPGFSGCTERADAITAATRDLVRPETARALGQFVDRWLDRSQRSA